MTTEELIRDEAETIIEDSTLDVIRRNLPVNYSGVEPFKEGGTRKVYLTRWGPNGQKRVIKVDKKPSTPHAKRNVERGYNTASEVQVASGIDDPDGHHLIRLYDYMRIPELGAMGFSDTASIEGYFPGETLEDRINSKGPLNAKEFEQAFRGVLDAERYLIKDQGIFHRDLNKKNILIRENGNVEARVTDLANACSVTSVTPKSRPTSGSRFVLDPTTEEVFTGKPSSHREESEIHAIGKNMLYSLTGKEVVRYDPDKGTAIEVSTGDSLLNTDGTINHKWHDEAITRVTLHLPKGADKYYDMIRRSLWLDESMRYHSFDDLIRDFENASKPTFWERIKKNKAVTAAIATGFLAVGSIFGGLVANQANQNKDLQAQVEFEKKHHVSAEWNGDNVEVGNNMVDMKVNMYNYQNEKRVNYPKDNYLAVEQGEKIHGSVRTQELARKDENNYTSLPSLEGRVYIEGYPASDDFYVHSSPFDGTKLDGADHWYSGGDVEIEIPKDIPDGNYAIAVELYARENPSDTSKNINETHKSFWFEKPGSMITRQRIPLVVGNPDKKVNLARIPLHSGSWSSYIGFADLDQPFDYGYISAKGLKYEYSIPEEDTSWTANKEYLHMPAPRDTLDKTLQIVYRDDSTNRVLGYTFVPIKGRFETNPNGYHREEYVYGIPGKEWSEKQVAFRKALQGDSSGLYNMQAEVKRYQEAERAKADSIRANDSILVNAMKGMR